MTAKIPGSTGKPSLALQKTGKNQQIELGKTDQLVSNQRDRIEVKSQSTKHFEVQSKQTDPEPNTSINVFQAAKQGDLVTLKWLTAKRNISPMIGDSKGVTPLHWAANYGHFKIVEYLIKNKNADPNTTDNNGNTPLHWAVSHGKIQIANYLVKRTNANPNAERNFGGIPLHIAAEMGNLEMLQLLVEEGHSNVYAQNRLLKRATPLHLAAQAGHLEAVQYLVIHGKTDPKIKAKTGMTPMHWAIEKNEWKVAGWLVSYSAQSSENIKTFLRVYMGKIDSEVEKDLHARRRQLLRQERLKALLKKNSAISLHNSNVRQLPKQFLKAVESLSTTDLLLETKKNLKRALKQSGDNKSAKNLISLLELCIYPHKLLIQNSNDPNSALKKIHSLIKKIGSIFKKLANMDSTIQAPMQQLINFYQNYCDRFLEASSAEERKPLTLPPVRISRMEHHQKILQTLAKPLLVKSLIEREKTLGHRAVTCEGLLFRVSPHAPGIEIAVDLLNDLLGRKKSSPKELLKITDQERKHHVVLASKPVDGIELLDLMMEHKQLWKKIDMNNFSKMVILSLLTSPQDGHPNQYRVDLKTDKKGEVTSWQLMSLDNSLAFGPSLLKSMTQGGKSIDIPICRTVLYLFSQMKLPIGSAFRKHFLKLKPELVLLEWLYALQQENQKFQKLMNKKVFSLAEYQGDIAISRGKKENNTPYTLLESPLNPYGLQLPIKLLPGAATLLYEKIRQIQSLFENPNTTSNQLFADLEPELYTAYSNILKENKGDIYQNLISLYELSRQELEKMKKSPVTKQEFEKKLSKEDLSHFTPIAIQTALAKNIEQRRDRTIPEIAAEWIAVLDWSQFSVDETGLYLSKIKTLDTLTTLCFNNCTALTDQNIGSYLKNFPKLKELTLKGKIAVTIEKICHLLSENKNLSIKINATTLNISSNQIRALFKEFGEKLTFLIDAKTTQLKTTEIYALANICREQIEMITTGKRGEELFRIGNKIQYPDLMLDRFIRRLSQDKALFDLIVYTFKNHPQPKMTYLDMRFNNGSTFLHQAAKIGNQRAYQWLLKAGANAKIKDGKGRTASELLKDTNTQDNMTG